MLNDSGMAPRLPRADGGKGEVARMALAGLTATPKTLPPSLFYDEEGCRLFYQITRLPEYYLTRTETRLLQEIAPALPIGAGGALVEFGGSDETKARILLDQPEARFRTYVPIDVAEPALLAMRERMRASHPGLRVVPVVGDFMRPLRLPPLGEPRLGFFPGSTIGNLDPDEAVRFMAAARASLGDGAWFLLGADLRKSPAILLPAYNDSAGVTAEFNLNLLRRLNREAEADFRLARFRHQAVWNDAASRIEMHLVAREAHVAHVAGQPVHFAEGESIHTENSYKRTVGEIAATVRASGWEVVRRWQDPAGLFGVFLLRA
ncbi:MAG TPA: L-histidine N(alpha)-methyltransferase [Rhodopila sp.]|nr:L-histidine N(alpha)-methyltransferase [Rhodopila sp.]